MTHKHSLYDTDPHFNIDPDSRILTDLSNKKTVIMESDHNSERFTFELPRYIDGHDMSLCNQVQIHYINIGVKERAEGIYLVDDLQISPEDDEIVICSWLVSRNATSQSGSLNFVIRFACIEEDEVVYSWNTSIYKDITIGQGINNSDSVAVEYADILYQWRLQIENDLNVRFEGVEEATNEAIRSAILDSWAEVHEP